MSQPATEPPVQEPAANNEPQETNQPPYFAQLESLPESVRPLVEPVFKEWDASTTKRFQELHSAQEPWKEVIESYEPATVTEAMQLAQMLEENPKQLWDLMAQHYQFQAEQGQPTATSTEPPAVVEPNEDDPYNDRFSKLEQTIEQLSGIIVNNQQLQTATEQQKMLDTVMADLTEKHGDFDQEYVLNRIVLGDEPDEAVKHYNTAIENAIKARGLSTNTSGAPVVVSNDGGTPSVTDGGKKLGEMSNSEVENQVAAMLRQSAEASS